MKFKLSALETPHLTVHHDEKELTRASQLQRNIFKHLAPMITTSLVAGLILSILAPYGTENFNLFSRLLFWTGMCVAGGFGAGAFDIILTMLGRDLKPWQQALGQSVGATLMVALFFFAMTYFQYGPQSLLNIVITLFYIWIISIIICSVGMLMRSKQVAKTRDRPALYERLKPHLRKADIYAIGSEDHYVRVYTSNGDDMILMRLSDAVKECTPLKGLPVHRSWWVAENGVKDVKRQDGKAKVTLKNDIVAPVSRTGLKSVREAGWL